MSNYEPPTGDNLDPIPTPTAGAVSGESDKSYLTTVLLSVLLGTVGADRFYLGQTGLGIAKLLTCGGCGVWALVDSIMTATGQRKDLQGRQLQGYEENRTMGLIITFGVIGLGIISSIISTAVNHG